MAVEKKAAPKRAAKAAAATKPATPEEPAEFKIPETLGACADLLYTTRQARLALAKQVETLEKREAMLKEHIIQTLPKSDSTGVAGRLARVSVVNKVVPRVEDWDKFYAFVKKTGDFSLLQRRLGDAAIQERWDNNKAVPGVTQFQAVTVSLGKLS